MEGGGGVKKSGNIKSIQNRVNEVNELIKEGNDKGVEVIDSRSTWEAPMKYKPIKYSNGVLYIEYEELNLYKYNRFEGTQWVTKKEKITKGGVLGLEEQKYTLTLIARMYRKAINHFNKYGYDDGGVTNDESWRDNKIYAVPMTDNDNIQGRWLPYFYLHGEAEKMNRYDICNANIETFKNCLRQGAFLCEVHFTDGSVHDAICFSKFDVYQMEGLVVLLSDVEHIKNALEYLDIKSFPSMFDDEIKHLSSIGLKQVISDEIKKRYDDGGVMARGGMTEHGLRLLDLEFESLDILFESDEMPDLYSGGVYDKSSSKIRAIIDEFNISEKQFNKVASKYKSLDLVYSDYASSNMDGGMMARGSVVKENLYKRWRVITKTENGREVDGYVTLGLDSKVSDVKKKMRSWGIPTRNIVSIERVMGRGGKNKYVDMFQDYDSIPPKLQAIFNRYYERYGEDMDYNDTQNMLDEVEREGYTFEYYLDNEPFGLRPIGVKLNELEGYEDAKEYDDGGDIDDYEVEKNYGNRYEDYDENFQRRMRDKYARKSMRVSSYTMEDYRKPYYASNRQNLVDIKPKEDLENGGNIVGLVDEDMMRDLSFRIKVKTMPLKDEVLLHEIVTIEEFDALGENKIKFPPFHLIYGKSSLGIFNAFGVDEIAGLQRSEAIEFIDNLKAQGRTEREDGFMAGLTNFSGDQLFMFFNVERLNFEGFASRVLPHEALHLTRYLITLHKNEWLRNNLNTPNWWEDERAKIVELNNDNEEFFAETLERTTSIAMDGWFRVTGSRCL